MILGRESSLPVPFCSAAVMMASRSYLFNNCDVTEIPVLAPAAGVTAAAVLGVALWFGTPFGHNAVMSADQSNFEDLDIVAASDEGTGDTMEMLQDDIDFYDWADKTAGSDPAA